MNLNRLRIFHTAAKLFSFTRAAEELHLTQPGISKHIRELEDYYGTKLFNRLGKRMALTQAGEILFRTTNDIFRLIDESKVRIDDLRGLKSGKLNIGASIMIGSYILPEMLAKFRHAHPDVDIALDISLSRHVADKVLSNLIEIGLVGHRVADKRLVETTFKADRLILAVSAKHKWAGRKSPVSLEELIAQPFLISKEGSGTRKFVEEQLEKSGVALGKTMELGNTEGVKKAVEADMGVSLLSKCAISRELDAGLIKSVPLKGMDLRRDLYIVYLKERYLSEAAKAFLGLF